MRFSLYLFLLFIIACGRNADDYSGKKIFRYNESSGINSLDPAFAKDQSGIWPSLQLYNGLVQLDSALDVVPCIASSWEISDSGKTYTFHLRGDVFFHRNEAFHTENSSRNVIAADFVYSLRRLTDPKIASPGSWVMKYVAKDINNHLQINAENDSILVIHLERSFPPFLGLLSMAYCSVIPHEVVEKYGIDFRNHPCGTGPFQFSFWREGVKLIFLKNENYFEKKNGLLLPYLDAVEISFISDKHSAFIEFLKGRLDFLSGIDASYKDELLTHSGKLQTRYEGSFQMEAHPYLNTEYLGILMDEKSDGISPLKIKLIRQALNYGFDRRKMISYLRNNIGTPGEYGMVPPGLPSFDKSEIIYSYDPAKARQLLKDAGYVNGKGLPEITLSTSTNYQDVSDYLKSQWEDIGFKIKIDVNQAAVLRKMISEQKINFFRGSWIADYPDAENYLSLFVSDNFAPNGPDYTHYSNKDFDRLYKQASAEINDSARMILYRKMDRIAMEDSPVIILYYDEVLRFYSNSITGLGTNAMNLLWLKEVRKR